MRLNCPVRECNIAIIGSFLESANIKGPWPSGLVDCRIVNRHRFDQRVNSFPLANNRLMIYFPVMTNSTPAEVDVRAPNLDPFVTESRLSRRKFLRIAHAHIATALAAPSAIASAALAAHKQA